MRELERDYMSGDFACTRLAIVGRGRLGWALAGALTAAGYTVIGPLGRGADGRGSDGIGVDAVLLCVPDDQIEAAAALIARGPLVGHCSGATTLAPLAPHEAFSLHPLMTVTPEGARFAGAGAAVSGSTGYAAAFAGEMARVLGMRTVLIKDEDRAAYHAAASIASNLLVTLEAAAERIAASAGAGRELLLPLVRAPIENWAAVGPGGALTGPVARGDEATVAWQRAAVADRAPDLLPMFDVLVEATRTVAGPGTARAARGGSSTGVPAVEETAAEDSAAEDSREAQFA
jgi:hypothetical protein